jgi:hypothetical protein
VSDFQPTEAVTAERSGFRSHISPRWEEWSRIEREEDARKATAQRKRDIEQFNDVSKAEGYRGLQAAFKGLSDARMIVGPGYAADMPILDACANLVKVLLERYKPKDQRVSVRLNARQRLLETPITFEELVRAAINAPDDDVDCPAYTVTFSPGGVLEPGQGMSLYNDQVIDVVRTSGA